MKIEELKELARIVAMEPFPPGPPILARALLAGIAEAERLATPETHPSDYQAGKQAAADAVLSAMEDAT